MINECVVFACCVCVDINYFHQPSVNVTKFQKGVSNLGTKVFNKLPSYIKIESDNPKKFKLVLQKFLYKNSFYSLDEYFQFRKVKN